MAVIKLDSDVRLLDIVSSLQQSTGLCLDVKRVQRILGSRCVEKVEQEYQLDRFGNTEEIKKVSTWVVLNK